MVSDNYKFALPATTSPVSLLVPQALFPLLMRRLKKEKGSLRFYLSRIALSAQRQAVTLPSVSRINTLYQQPGLDLIRLNVRLPSFLWVQLRAVARSRGVSACCLFSFLLQRDSENEEGVGTPALKRLQFREILDLVRKTLYRELRIEAAAPG